MDRYFPEYNDNTMDLHPDGTWVKVEDVEKRLEEIKESQGPRCTIPEELFEI